MHFMSTDVTDAMFQTAVLERSKSVPVVIDLWAPWCGPCRTLGPILEKVIAETDGRVEMVKVNVDENPAIAQAFQAQSIPLVVALVDGQPVDGFVGAQPEATVREFVERLLTGQPDPVGDLVALGDEASLNEALTLDPGHAGAVVALATLFVESDRHDEALALLARIPESDETRLIAARARLATRPADNYDDQLVALLDTVKDDLDARQSYVDILELMGAEDPRTAQYRKKLTSRLF